MDGCVKCMLMLPFCGAYLFNHDLSVKGFTVRPILQIWQGIHTSTPPMFNIAPESGWLLISFWDVLCSGAMLVFGRVNGLLGPLLVG